MAGATLSFPVGAAAAREGAATSTWERCGPIRLYNRRRLPDAAVQQRQRWRAPAYATEGQREPGSTATAAAIGAVALEPQSAD